jgi:hypothetical protein
MMASGEQPKTGLEMLLEKLFKYTNATTCALLLTYKTYRTGRLNSCKTCKCDVKSLYTIH